MRTTTPLTRLVFGVILGCAATCMAQPGHGGVPPGQAKKHGDHIPPGQAKKYFRDEDRPKYYSHYRKDTDYWNGRKNRPVFVVGQPIPHGYVVQPMPESYWRGAPTPPPGYQYGYYGGYAVIYNPTTRVVADVMDLIGAATGH